MRIFVSICLVLCINAAFGQPQFSLYRLQKSLPQSNMLNPAFAPGFKLVIGLPVISSAHVSADLDGLAFNDVFNRSGGEYLTFDTVRIFDKMKDVNHVRFSQSIQLLYLGMTVGKSYVSVGLHEVSAATMNYPGDLVGWAIRGPGHPGYVGSPLNLGSLHGKGLAYNKASISLGRSFGDRLRVGARFNYLMGLGMIESTKVSGKVIVGIDSVAVQTGVIQVNTSGIDFFTRGGHNAGDYLNYIIKSTNKGVAWDFGATYKITHRLSASAAINNIGHINWRDYTRSYHHKPVTYTYRGIDLQDYLDNNSPQVNVDNEVDSLRNLFNPTEITGEKYITRFTGNVYAGVNYHVLPRGDLSALLYFDLRRHKQNPALSLGYTMQLGRILNASVGATFQQRKIDIGAGLAVKLSKIQVFAASDPAQTVIYPARATKADVHTGVNLVFQEIDEEDVSGYEENKRAKAKMVSLLKKKRAAWPSALRHPRMGRTRTDKADRVAPAGRRTDTQPRPPVTQPGAIPLEKQNEIARHGVRDDVSHIVIVGTFTSKEKADLYSRDLTERGFANKLGYDSETAVYRVYVYRSREKKEARRICKGFRKKGEPEFAKAWVLSIVDSKFD
jgi:hypothetical protein